ncbi:MAG: histidinol-phosphate aminotransferase family protein [Dehalococcoidales bacterium]|nr:histidinol-phosphate aminotransferase family protein [Dehalococcoidales bacterium]
MSLRPRPEVENLEICAHGGLNQAELKAMGLNPDSVVDFSVCTNPFMPPPGLQKVVDTVAVSRYPDSEATEFRQCLSQRLEVPPDNILAGNGSTELVRLIALTYFSHGDSVLIIEPTFGEYEVACQITGAGVVKQWGREEDNFTIRVEETANLIRQHQPKGVFICNPNNPTGQYLTRQEVEAVLDACGDGLLVLDEAYVTFVNGIWSSIDLIHRGNVIVVRSMTKDYALAGLRLGYAVASEEIINALRRVCPPWNVNTVAQKAGVIALDNTEHLEWCKGEIQRAKQFLVDELHRLGFTLVPSDAHFFLIKVNSASDFRTALLQQGIQVRDCASFGLPGYVRIAPRTMPECQRLIAIIQAMKG